MAVPASPFQPAASSAKPSSSAASSATADMLAPSMRSSASAPTSASSFLARRRRLPRNLEPSCLSSGAALGDEWQRGDEAAGAVRDQESKVAAAPRRALVAHRGGVDREPRGLEERAFGPTGVAHGGGDARPVGGERGDGTALAQFLDG